MYQELILILIVLTVIYFMFFNDSRIEWEAFNGVKYKIKNDNKELNQIKADFLAKLDDKARKIVKSSFTELVSFYLLNMSCKLL